MRARSRAWAKTGNRIAARMAIMAITTSSSIKVNARLRVFDIRSLLRMKTPRLSPPCSPRRRRFLLDRHLLSAFCFPDAGKAGHGEAQAVDVDVAGHVEPGPGLGRVLTGLAPGDVGGLALRDAE